MSMNDDIKEFPVFLLYAGTLQKADWITNTESYDHYNWQLHHFVKQQEWKRNGDRLKTKGIEQKLILMPIQCHLDLHACLSSFEDKWRISRDKLLYGARL